MQDYCRTTIVQTSSIALTNIDVPEMPLFDSLPYRLTTVQNRIEPLRSTRVSPSVIIVVTVTGRRRHFYFLIRVLNCARTMNEAPVSCLPTNTKMSRTKKVIEEAKEIQNPELDLADKGISTFEEMPGLCEYLPVFRRPSCMTKFGNLSFQITFTNMDILGVA